MIWLCVLAMGTASLVFGSGNTSVWTSQSALENLQNGNERFISGKPKVWDSGAAAREKLSTGQSPYACVITCSDSRVPPEEIFDTGLGELFVIRVAGNVTPADVVASADYAVGHLNCPVVVVMGHTRCGAVGAALSESEFAEPLNSLITQIKPHAEACQAKGYAPEEIFAGVVKENARAGAVHLLAGSRAIEQAVMDGKCVVLSAVYDIETGVVDWQSQLGKADVKSSKELISTKQLQKPISSTNRDGHDSEADKTQTARSTASSKARH